jgi:chromosome segregation ATPase
VKISELRNQAHDHEKLKAILEYQLTDLKGKVEPKDQSLKSMKDEIVLIDAELDVYNEKNYYLDLEVGKSVAQQAAVKSELAHAQTQLKEVSEAWEEIQDDLSQIDISADPKELRTQLMALHSKHIAGHKLPPRLGRRGAERERELLERSIASLKRKVEDGADNYRREISRLNREECELVASLNALRREEQTMRTEVTEMQGIVNRN